MHAKTRGFKYFYQYIMIYIECNFKIGIYIVHLLENGSEKHQEHNC